VVVGASLAGLSAVRALRARGFDGPITVVGDEPHLPYERPALSKEFLHTGEPTGLLDEDGELDRLGATWLTGRPAVGLTAAAGPIAESYAPVGAHTVHLDDGSSVGADIVIAATGARARRLPGLSGVHYLRGLDDARRLREILSCTKHLMVVGGGFIGAEVAATASTLGIEVTVAELSPIPAGEALGNTVAAACAARHARHGVRLLTGVGVSAVCDGIVQLTDGARLSADAVVAGVGAVPNTEWAGCPALHIDDGFRTDARGLTSVPGIYAIGDCARVHDPARGRQVRAEHWHSAIAQAHAAAAAITGTAPPAATAPYFWSRQYGALLQFAGVRDGDEQVRVVDGALDGPSFTVLYERDGVPVAVCALDNPRLFTRHRKQFDRACAAAAEPVRSDP
jgi:3-phenylpropionate/trans-cinnamate dioxygenase ferredoxin reductase subunit